MDYTKLQNGSDIRGVAMEGIEGQHVNLTEQACRDIGRGFALWLRARLGAAGGEAGMLAAARQGEDRSWRCGSWRQWPPRACRSRTSAWPRPRPCSCPRSPRASPLMPLS